jgi:hypothetical protein
LQGLATGQLNGGTSGESGLAQLTRMVQASQVPDQVSQGQAAPPEDTYVLPTYTPPIARVGSASEAISSQVLRPAPIQDLPEERPVITSPLGADVQRKPEVFSRANHNQPASAQVPSSTAQSPLASLSTSGMAAHAMSTSARRETGDGPDQSVISKDPQKSQENGTEARHVQEHPVNSSSERKQETYEVGGQDEEHNDDKQTRAEDSVILDILQSLPLIPTVGQQQALQAQVLNGRATRSLGSVLLDGHLVPQERLAVAQNIQRMLRGVDLNYQLGEILLMFKLLTPDQLLAASLVSYGLITTTQVSAFGRIRQELHAIGLEYDLENLLVLFRVLTPEQLREARSQIQN